MTAPATPEPKRTGGGAATAAGIEFQNRTAAWFAARILAEEEAQPLWDWPATTALRILRCETEQPVDDILVTTSDGRVGYVQAKRSIAASAGGDSPLASVFSQYVRQYLRPPLTGDASLPWNHSFDAMRDRLVLAVGKDTSATIAVHARQALTKLRQSAGQGLDDPGLNDQEREALAVCRRHADAAWTAAQGKAADEADLRSLLRATYITVVDVEPLGEAEREAKELLRRSVLEQPAQADVAWAKLLEICAGFSRTRGGTDHTGLNQTLATTGLALKVPTSYRRDVEMLRAYSQRTVNLLARFSDIRIGRTGRVKIDRESTTAMREATNRGSLLVIGEPGAGKSGALHDLATWLVKDGAALLCLATDEVAATSAAELTKELGLEHPLPDVLANWGSPSRPVYLVTDALDAARTDYAGEMFRKLIESALQLGPSCRVVASIRMFDLRNDGLLRELFAGEPHTRFVSAEFGQTRHFQVPVLSEQELQQLGAQSDPLARLVQAVLAGSNGDMRALIAVPFNLRLLGELIGEGATVDSLTPIRTQVELLDRYWRERVLRAGKDKRGDARETVLRKIARKMFDTRLLHAPRSVVNADANDSAILQDLLSADVLQENHSGAADGQGRETLKFPHHLLFDYALARLLLRVNHASLAALIAGDPDCVVAFRPSLILHFRHLWESQPDHATFWALVFALNANPQIPRVGKIIGPAVATDLCKKFGDFAPYFATVAEEIATTEGQRQAGEITSYLTGALAAKGGIRRNDEGGEAALWAEFAAGLARHVNVLAYSLRHLLFLSCNPAEQIPHAAMRKIGEAGRVLLDYALRPGGTYDGNLVRGAMEAIARTYASNPGASQVALSRLLEPTHVAAQGHKELFFLSQEISRLLPQAPSLVADVYSVAFAAETDSEEKTQIGGSSRIMPLISNVRQDWQGVHYALAKAFPEFIRKAPREAVKAAMDALAVYVERHHSRREPSAEPGRFNFLGQEATITTDFSSIWDAEGTVGSREDSAIELLAVVMRTLGALDGAEGEAAQLTELLTIIARDARHAIVWRRLLYAGATHPARLGRQIAELARRDPILACLDTHEAVGKLLAAIYPSLSPEERGQIESALMAFPVRAGAIQSDERQRDRYLGCIPRALVATEPARRHLAELDANGGPPPNVPYFRMSPFESGNISDEEFMRHQGVPVDAPANRRLLDLIRPLKTTFHKGAPQAPAPEEPGITLDRLRQLKAALKDEEEAEATPDIKRQALAYLADACASALQLPWVETLRPLKEFARTTLLEIANVMPEGPLTTNEQFDQTPGWGSPHALIAAAEGFLISKDPLDLAARTAVDAAVDRLAQAPEPEVRFQIARYAGAYARTNEARLWKLLRTIAERDPSSGVLSAVLMTATRSWEPVALALVERIFARARELTKNDSIREICLDYFVALHLHRTSGAAWAHLQPIADVPWEHSEDAQLILANLRDSLALGSAEPEVAADTVARHRAQDLFRRIVEAASNELNRIIAEYEKIVPEAVPSQVRERVQSLQQCVHTAADHVYFASGAFELRSAQEPGGKLTLAQRRRFWNEMQGILRLLASSRVPSVSYHLIETLESLVSFDPRAVFLEISRAVQSGKEGGFQFESLVADMAVRLVKEFIAIHGALLKEDKECRRALIDVLDTFVEAGWPAAQQLTFGLEDIFR